MIDISLSGPQSVMNPIQSRGPKGHAADRAVALQIGAVNQHRIFRPGRIAVAGDRDSGRVSALAGIGVRNIRLAWHIGQGTP